MKYNKYLHLSYIVLIASTLFSCSGILDQAPDGKTSLEDVFKDNDKVAAYLNSCYRYMPGHGFCYQYFERGPACWCDDAWDANCAFVTWGNSAILYSGAGTAENDPRWQPVFNWMGDRNTHDYWDHNWQCIHDCAYFLQQLPNATVTNENDRSRWGAEAHLLRAYYYEELLRWFGRGLPIVDTPYDLNADFKGVKCASFYETVQFIIKDCDAALSCADLPWRITTDGENGRLPKSIAWAIKSRMALYAASPLYTGSDDHWQEAYTITKAAKDALKSQGYKLYTTMHDVGLFAGPNSYFAYDGYPEDLKKKAGIYNELFCTSLTNSSTPVDCETIFQTQTPQPFCHLEGMSAQNGTYCTGTCPSQELVDSYETYDGQPVVDIAKPYLDEETHMQPNFNKNNTLYNDQDPYKNRDPRFYASIYYNGSQRYAWWTCSELPACKENYPGNPGVRLRNVMTYIGEPITGYNPSNWSLTNTGYYIRKFIDPNVGVNNQHNEANFKEYRYAEILLNYAEAAAQTNHPTEAIDAVNEIRDRVGMPHIPSTLTGEALLQRIYHERRIEFALEEQRYFDVRRWTKPDGDLAKTDKWVSAIHITRNDDGSFTYNRGLANGKQRECYTNKYLKCAIPMSEANRILAITGESWQNPGW
jgi:hypothetical protein